MTRRTNDNDMTLKEIIDLSMKITNIFVFVDKFLITFVSNY